MKKLFIMGAICLTACSTKEDKIPFAVFDAIPVDYREDIEPVYIDLNDIKDFQEGDTVQVNDNGRIPADTGGHWVVLDRRLPVDSLFTRDSAEDGQ